MTMNIQCLRFSCPKWENNYLHLVSFDAVPNPYVELIVTLVGNRPFNRIFNKLSLNSLALMRNRSYLVIRDSMIFKNGEWP